MLRMTIEGIGFDHLKQTVVLLKDQENKKLLPIWIGPAEARSIALQLEGTSSPRPLGHDLLMNCIKEGGGRITRVVINDLQDATFYATVDIDTKKGMLHMDARPSDAIALAVRAKCPVFVDGGALDALVDMNDETEETHDAASDSPPVEESSSDERESQKRDEAQREDAKSRLGASDDELDRFKRLVNDLEI